MIYNYILYGNRVVGLLWPYYCGRTVFIFAKQELLDKSRSIGYPDYDIDVTVCAFGASEMTAAKAEFDFQIMY